MRKRVYIVYTGGTIGMIPTSDGYVPAPGYLAEQIAAMPELQSDLMPEVEIHEYDTLLDSSNMTPADWHKIASDIAAHDEQFDGFIVLHGTDTMAYTASALPFMLHGLRKPVIVTGSQIPLCQIRNDARANLITAMLIAANFPIPEVCLYFGQQLLRGCRAVKVSANGFEAFASPNLPPLGDVGVDIRINWDLVLPPSAESGMHVQELRPVNVGALRLWPGISAQIVRNLLQPPLTGTGAGSVRRRQRADQQSRFSGRVTGSDRSRRGDRRLHAMPERQRQSGRLCHGFGAGPRGRHQRFRYDRRSRVGEVGLPLQPELDCRRNSRVDANEFARRTHHAATAEKPGWARSGCKVQSSALEPV